jgi:hypothetical protein
MTVQIQIRRDTAVNWINANPILAIGELGYETNTKQLKIGNGSDNWLTLGYFSPADTNTPTVAEKQALAGTSGTPGTGNKYVTDGDTRNSNARTPTTHAHAPGDVTGTAVVTADARLSDARTPIAHGHAPSDVTGTAVVTADSRLSDTRDPKAHAHAPSDVTGTAVVTADSRLSDDRIPTSHGNTKHSSTFIVQADAVIPNGAITGATKTKVTYDAKGLVTSGADATQDDIGDGSTNKQYSATDKSKLAGIASGANVGVVPNGVITGATKTKVTYDAKGLVTAGVDATTADVADSADKRYCTDAQKTVIGNTSGTNSGDGAANSSSMYIGTTSHALNRASAAETIAGLTLTTPNIGAATGTGLAATTAITSSGSAGGGVGYATGAGGTAVQGSSRTTTVVLNKLCGTFTMFSAAQAAQAIVTFTLTNSFIAAGDFVLIQHISATNGGAWQFSVVAAAGSCTITVRNVSNASITEATPLRISVIKGVTA